MRSVLSSLLKRIPFLCSLLCSVGIFSIGFSSWINLIPPTTERYEKGSLVSYGANSATCTSIKMFDYSATSFLAENASGSYVDSNIGIISAMYVVTPDSSLSSWTVDFSLTYSNLLNKPTNGIFSTIEPGSSGNLQRSLTSSVYLCKVVDGVVSDDEATKINSSISIDNSSTSESATISVRSSDLGAKSSVYYLRVDFEFNIPSGASFRQTFGKHLSTLSNSLTTFTTSANFREGVSS